MEIGENEIKTQNEDQIKKLKRTQMSKLVNDYWVVSEIWKNSKELEELIGHVWMKAYSTEK